MCRREWIDMKEYVITTDDTCDMPESFYKEYQIPYVSLNCMVNGQTFNKDHRADPHEFYEWMRSGAMPTTSQVNAEDMKDCWLPYIKKGLDILHIGFSSGLSGSFNSARIAAEELMEEYPDVRIRVVDSLCASMGEGLLLFYAVKQKEAGKTLDEVGDYLEENKLVLCHVFTVDDLFHLHRGGRVSKLSAIVGTMVGIKPMLHVDNEGHLILLSKTRGRKRALSELVHMMDERIGSYRDRNPAVFISHGDCEEDARLVADLVREKYQIEDIRFNTIGATIGAHAGPGTVALFFLGDHR